MQLRPPPVVADIVRDRQELIQVALGWPLSYPKGLIPVKVTLDGLGHQARLNLLAEVTTGLNALAGSGVFSAKGRSSRHGFRHGCGERVLMPLRAVGAFGQAATTLRISTSQGLNALAGRRGFRTENVQDQRTPTFPVSMPLRAVGAFGRYVRVNGEEHYKKGLNALAGSGVFSTLRQALDLRGEL